VAQVLLCISCSPSPTRNQHCECPLLRSRHDATPWSTGSQPVMYGTLDLLRCQSCSILNTSAGNGRVRGQSGHKPSNCRPITIYEYTPSRRPLRARNLLEIGLPWSKETTAVECGATGNVRPSGTTLRYRDRNGNTPCAPQPFRTSAGPDGPRPLNCAAPHGALCALRAGPGADLSVQHAAPDAVLSVLRAAPDAASCVLGAAPGRALCRSARWSWGWAPGQAAGPQPLTPLAVWESQRG
jgi:hypothetical protein